MADTDLFQTSSDDTAKAFLAAPDVAHETKKPQPDQMDLLPTRQQYDKTLGDLTKIQEEKTKSDSMMQSTFEQQDKQNRSRMERLFAAQGATIDDLKPWHAQQELADRKTDLWEQFGSPGFIIAMLGSAFSAQPMNSALNSGAAAMNAINQGDMQAYNRAFDAWKENTKLTLDRQKLEHELYDEADKLRERDMAAWRAKVAAVAARFDDKRKLALLQNGMDGELITALGSEAQAAQKLGAARDGLMQQKLKMDMLNVDKDWTSGDPSRMKRAHDRVEAGQLTPEQDFMQRFDKEHPDAKFDERLEAYKQFETAKYPYRGAAARQLTPEQELWHQFNKDEPEAPLNRRMEVYKEIQAGKYAYRTAGALTAGDITAVKGDLETALGHPLSPGTNAAIDSAYSAKGVGASRAVASVNRAIAGIKQDIASGKQIDAAEIDRRLNEALQAGSMTGGRSAASAFINKVQIEHPDWNANQINKAAALYTETQSRARTLGTRSASVDAAVVEADKIADKVLAASKKVPRGNWVPLTDLQQKVARGISSPEQKELDNYTAGLITAYAQTMSRTGANTVTAQNRATELLDVATGPEAFERGVKVLQDEMRIVQEAVREIKPELEESSGAPHNDPLGIR